MQIRKGKKEERLAKRRSAMTMSVGAEPTDASETLPQLLAAILTNPAPLEAVRSIRKRLSKETDPQVKEIIQAGFIPHLVRLLSHDSWDVQFESAWALTNIAASSDTNVVVEACAVPPLVSLLKSSDCKVREQAAWCLGNIAGDRQAYRDSVLHAGAVDPL